MKVKEAKDNDRQITGQIPNGVLRHIRHSCPDAGVATTNARIGKDSATFIGSVGLFVGLFRAIALQLKKTPVPERQRH